MADNVSSSDVKFHLGGRYKAWDALHLVKMCLSMNKTPPISIFDEIKYACNAFNCYKRLKGRFYCSHHNSRTGCK